MKTLGVNLPQPQTDAAADTKKLVKPIKITDLDSTGTTMAKLASDPAQSTTHVCSICLHGHSGVNNQIHETKAICMSV